MSKSKPFNVRIDRELLARLRGLPTLPWAKDLALTKVINAALRDWIDRAEAQAGGMERKGNEGKENA